MIKRSFVRVGGCLVRVYVLYYVVLYFSKVEWLLLDKWYFCSYDF